jgi:hypothetical protein
MVDTCFARHHASASSAHCCTEEAVVSLLSAVLDTARSGAVEVVDLTTLLQESPPILQLPAPFASTTHFHLEELSRYDDKGPAWYWNDIHTGEHAGTHVDAPVHWITGKNGPDVSQASSNVKDSNTYRPPAIRAPTKVVCTFLTALSDGFPLPRCLRLELCGDRRSRVTLQNCQGRPRIGCPEIELPTRTPGRRRCQLFELQCAPRVPGATVSASR